MHLVSQIFNESVFLTIYLCTKDTKNTNFKSLFIYTLPRLKKELVGHPEEDSLPLW